MPETLPVFWVLVWSWAVLILWAISLAGMLIASRWLYTAQEERKEAAKLRIVIFAQQVKERTRGNDQEALPHDREHHSEYGSTPG